MLKNGNTGVDVGWAACRIHCVAPFYVQSTTSTMANHLRTGLPGRTQSKNTLSSPHLQWTSRGRPGERRELQKIVRYRKNALPSPLWNIGKPPNRQGAWCCWSLEKGETRCWKRRYQQGSLLFYWLPWQQPSPSVSWVDLQETARLSRGTSMPLPEGLVWDGVTPATSGCGVWPCGRGWRVVEGVNSESALLRLYTKEVPWGPPERASPATQRAPTMREASITDAVMKNRLGGDCHFAMEDNGSSFRLSFLTSHTSLEEERGRWRMSRLCLAYPVRAPLVKVFTVWKRGQELWIVQTPNFFNTQSKDYLNNKKMAKRCFGVWTRCLTQQKESINTVDLKAGDNGGGGSLYTNKLTDTPL